MQYVEKCNNYLLQTTHEQLHKSFPFAKFLIFNEHIYLQWFKRPKTVIDRYWTHLANQNIRIYQTSLLDHVFLRHAYSHNNWQYQTQKLTSRTRKKLSLPAQLNWKIPGQLNDKNRLEKLPKESKIYPEHFVSSNRLNLWV